MFILYTIFRDLVAWGSDWEMRVIFRAFVGIFLVGFMKKERELERLALYKLEIKVYERTICALPNHGK